MKHSTEMFEGCMLCAWISSPMLGLRTGSSFFLFSGLLTDLISSLADGLRERKFQAIKEQLSKHTSLHSSPCTANTLHSHLSAIPFIPLFCSPPLSRGTSRWVLITTPGHAVCFHLPQGLSRSLHATVQTHQPCVWREMQRFGERQ